MDERYTLLQAVRDNDTAQVLELLKKGVSPNYLNYVTPLQVAVRLGNEELVAALLRAGANPNTRSIMGHTCIQYAMISQLPEEVMMRIVAMLLERGAKADTAGSWEHHFKIARRLNNDRLLELLGCPADYWRVFEPATPAQQAEYKTRLQAQQNPHHALAWAGLMVGDALGAPAEFCRAHEIRRAYPQGMDKMVRGFGICTDRKPGEVTDDTQMAYCLHLALQDAGGWDAAAACRRYQEWFATDPADVGEAVKAALEGTPDAESQGNGALMRVLPIALWAAEHPDFEWVTAAREDAAITHPHPVCGDANVVYVHALLQAMLPGATPRGIYESALAFAAEQGVHAPVLRALKAAATERPDYDGENIGWVLVALQSAFYQLLHAADFRSALVDIVSAGGDTDTNAAIAGALLALVHGGQSIPRNWLVAVRAVNDRCYARLLPKRS